jgi:hypothetical protein
MGSGKLIFGPRREGEIEMEEEREKLIVEHNLRLCEKILLQCELVNKGRYTHTINSLSGKLKTMLSKLPENPSLEEIRPSIKIRTVLSETLYFLSQNM